MNKKFFIDGPGSKGKTFVYKALYHILNGKKHKVKYMAFTGIGSILLPEGRTSHQTFGLKLPFTSEFVSAIKPGSHKAAELTEVDLFLMDEAPKLPKYGLHNMDQLLRSIGNRNSTFGIKIAVLGGDFRHCLPVQNQANKSELIDLSIKNSELWIFKFFSLKEKIRLDPEQKEFAKYLLKIANSVLSVNGFGGIKLPTYMIFNGDLIDDIFGYCFASRNYEDMKNRAILAPIKKDVSKINADIM